MATPWRSESMVSLLQQADDGAYFRGPRAVAYGCDVLVTHNRVTYNIALRNCATFADCLLHSYGVNCQMVPHLATPWCELQAGAIPISVTPKDVFARYDRHYRQQVLTVSSIRDTLRGFGESKTCVHLIRNLDGRRLSWHLGILIQDDSQSLSFCGWPYDTIDELGKLPYLVSNRFTVCFPDPCMSVGAASDSTYRNLTISMSLLGSTVPTQRPREDMFGFGQPEETTTLLDWLRHALLGMLDSDGGVWEATDILNELAPTSTPTRRPSPLPRLESGIKKRPSSSPRPWALSRRDRRKLDTSL